MSKSNIGKSNWGMASVTGTSFVLDCARYPVYYVEQRNSYPGHTLLDLDDFSGIQPSEEAAEYSFYLFELQENERRNSESG